MKRNQIILCLLMISLLMLILTGCYNTPAPSSGNPVPSSGNPAPSSGINNAEEELINATHCGIWISEDMILRDSVSITISGELPKSIEQGKMAIAELSIAWGENFPYLDNIKHTYSVASYSFNTGDVRQAYVYYGTAFHKAENLPCRMIFTIMDDKCIVFEFSNSPGMYLVAVPDPELDVVKLIEDYKKLFAY